MFIDAFNQSNILLNSQLSYVSFPHPTHYVAGAVSPSSNYLQLLSLLSWEISNSHTQI